MGKVTNLIEVGNLGLQLRNIFLLELCDLLVKSLQSKQVILLSGGALQLLSGLLELGRDVHHLRL